MGKTELKKYLSFVLETEKNVLILKKTANKTYNRIQNLGKAKQIKKPAYTKITSSLGGGFSSIYFAVVAGAAIGLIVAIVRWLGRAIAETTGGGFIFEFIWNLFAELSMKDLGICIGIGAGIGALVGIPIFIYYLVARSSDNRVEQQNYEVSLSNEQNRVVKELAIKKDAEKYYATIQKQLKATEQVLKQLYSLNILHKNFRNIIAVASIYQYLDTGMCTALEGHEGAYTLYLHESWYQKLSSQLDNIIDRLDQIQANQFVLLQAVKSANERIDKLAKTSELTLAYAKATARNSEIIAYNTEVTARNTEFLAWMEIYKSLRR